MLPAVNVIVGLDTVYPQLVVGEAVPALRFWLTPFIFNVKSE